jgi:hypothetical protein
MLLYAVPIRRGQAEASAEEFLSCPHSCHRTKLPFPQWLIWYNKEDREINE